MTSDNTPDMVVMAESDYEEMIHDLEWLQAQVELLVEALEENAVEVVITEEDVDLRVRMNVAGSDITQ